MSFIPEFCKETEALLLSCITPLQTNYPDSNQTLRNHFTNLFLKRFLPPTIQIGSGEIVDYFGTRSSHQNLILYRSNFPVFPSNTGSKIYLIESVLATIEILQPNDNPGLTQPFLRCSALKNLRTGNHKILANNSKDYMELSSRLKIKTFIFSFQPIIDHQAFYQNYQKAKRESISVVPDGICIPGDNGLYAQYGPYNRNINFFTDDSFARFFNHIFNVLVGEINATNLNPESSASIKYDLSNYLITPQPARITTF
jgi:hypothetical protein